MTCSTRKQGTNFSFKKTPRFSSEEKGGVFLKEKLDIKTCSGRDIRPTRVGHRFICSDRDTAVLSEE